MAPWICIRRMERHTVLSRRAMRRAAGGFPSRRKCRGFMSGNRATRSWRIQTCNIPPLRPTWNIAPPRKLPRRARIFSSLHRRRNSRRESPTPRARSRDGAGRSRWCCCCCAWRCSSAVHQNLGARHLSPLPASSFSFRRMGEGRFSNVERRPSPPPTVPELKDWARE